ncbi:hypothetical protein [Marinobacter sp. AL4B]|uniref:hypothetical protein n=1 Tax=Marinobacter sp. AL4B TaxID=2871173 RepID=UPI001CAA5410|nr:hypothetical protein [Marinobacter sp. AL4B]MBZ0333210.1 hypothetical protein [Marinobacter sp. AL4B]
MYFVISGSGVETGGASDADYYHAYAIGNVNNVVNFWPVILRFLNDIGLYDRQNIAIITFLLSLTLIPILLYKIILQEGFLFKSKLFLYVYFVFSLYPTLYIFTLDVYRDIAMFTVLLISWYFLRRYYNNKVLGFYNLVAFFALGYLCYLLRPYLGFSVVVSFFIYNLYSKTARYTRLWVIFYFISLMVFQSLGLFNEITEYRGLDGFTGGGSTLGIGLHGRSPVVFAGLYVLSFLGQVFGLFIVNAYAVALFIIETIPFILALRYVIKNKKNSTPFCHYLLVFFVIYTTVWVVGNDNLGTAVRLRFHSYMAIFICFFIVYQNKLMHTLLPSNKRNLA